MATNDFKGMRDCWLCDLTERAEEIEYALRVAEHNIAAGRGRQRRLAIF